MGGANESFYCTKIELDNELTGFLKLTLLNGETVKQNPSFIVNVTKCSVVKVVHDITSYVNYRNKVCKKSIITEYIYLKPNEDYEVVNEIVDRNDTQLTKRVIFTEKI